MLLYTLRLHVQFAVEQDRIRIYVIARPEFSRRESTVRQGRYYSAFAFSHRARAWNQFARIDNDQIAVMKLNHRYSHSAITLDQPGGALRQGELVSDHFSTPLSELIENQFPRRDQ